MKDVIFKNRWVQIVYGALLMVAGVLTLVFAVIPQTSGSLTDAISIIVAVCCFILGVVYIASSFASETKVLFPASLLFGSFCIAIGILLCVDKSVLGAIIVYLVGALLVVYGSVCAIKAITFILIKAKVRYIVLFFAIAAILITLGVLSFVYRTQANVVIYAGTGGVIAIYGIVEIIIAGKKMAKANKDNKVVETQKPTKEKKQIEKKETNVIDAEVKDVENK